MAKAAELVCPANGELVLAFFTKKYVLSNHFLTNFAAHGITFHSSEQYYMWKRAVVLENEVAVGEILSSVDARSAQTIGKNLPEMKVESMRAKWHKLRFQYMAEALLLKFNLNELCLGKLLETGQFHLVEASRFDHTWGVGASIEEIESGARVTGLNALGTLLVALRESIRDGWYADRPWVSQSDMENPEAVTAFQWDVIGLLERAKMVHKQSFGILYRARSALAAAKEFIFPPPDYFDQSDKLTTTDPSDLSSLHLTHSTPTILSHPQVINESPPPITFTPPPFSPIPNHPSPEQTEQLRPDRSPEKRRSSADRAEDRKRRRERLSHNDVSRFVNVVTVNDGTAEFADLSQSRPLQLKGNSRGVWKDIDSSEPHYIVVQTGERANAAVCALLQSPRLFPGWPITIEVPAIREKDINRGDLLRFDRLGIVALPAELTIKLVRQKTYVNAQARGAPVAIRPAINCSALGIIIGRTRATDAQRRNRVPGNCGKPIVEVYGLATALRLTTDQIHESYVGELVAGTMIKAQVFQLPPRSRCSHSYWLPANFPVTENWEMEKTRGNGFPDIHVSWIESLEVTRDELILPLVEESQELISNAEESIALANQVYANSLREMSESVTVNSRLTKVPASFNVTGQQVENNLWKAQVLWKEKDKRVIFLKSWRTDTPVRIFPGHLNPECCATGSILSVAALGNMNFEITLAIDSVAKKQARVDFFHLFTLSNTSVTIRVLPSVSRILQRAECWFTHRPSKLAREVSSRGQILAALLGLKHPNPLIVPDLSWAQERDPGELLNKEQLQTYLWILSGIRGILHQIAPCGTGKTFCIAIAIAQLLIRDPTANVVLTTRSNGGLKRLVEEVIGLLGDFKSMVILSGPAKDTHARDFAPFRSHLLVAAAEDLLAELGFEPSIDSEKEKDKDFLAQYIEDCGSHPRKAHERIALNVVKCRKQDLPRIIFATTAMLEDLSAISFETTHLFVDEAGQSAVDQTIPIICEMPQLRQVVFTGDERQLLNYIQDIPEIVRDFGSGSLLSHLSKAQDSQIMRVVLKTTYRFHPCIAECIAATGYGKELAAGAPAEDRAMITDAPLSFPQQDFPVLLLHQDEEDEREVESYSRHNIAQANSASAILVEMLRRLPCTAKVVVLCLYAAQKEQMREHLRVLNLDSVKVVSADGFQANEADFVYIVTTRSINNTEDDRVLEFIKDERRATVAISRAKHGLILHGNLQTMSIGIVWKKFMLEALKHTKVCSPFSYLRALQSGTQPDTLTLPCLSAERTTMHECSRSRD